MHLPYRYVPPQSVWFLHRFGLKTGIDFTYFGLSSGVVLGEIRECMNVFVVSISNEKERKSNMRIRNGFLEIVLLAF